MQLDRVKKLRRSIVDQKYTTYYKGATCYYCGDLAEALDHCPAIDAVYAWGEDRFRRRNIPLIKVSVCRQCNSVLGAKPIHTLRSRTKYLYDKYSKLFMKKCYLPDWEPDEVDELGPNLLSYIQAQTDIKTWFERRLAYMEDVHYDWV